MRTHVALLRGINVGGRNKVAMADLRQIAASLGHTDVATYIQSGNVVFTSTETSSIKLADAMEQEIARRLEVKPGVVVLSRDQLAGVIAGNPYPQAADPRRLHVVFRREDLNPEEIAAILAAQQRASDKGSRDEAAVVRGTLFLHTPDGMGRSELAAQLARSAIGTGTAMAGTARNWATVTRLLALLADLSQDCPASSLFPAHQNDQPYRHRDGHHEYAHSKSLRDLREVEAAHGQSLVERRQPYQARGARRPWPRAKTAHGPAVASAPQAG